MFTWPDLVYSELICMVRCGAILLVWSLLVPAPLEQPANPALTPNPSKAPWYFLGLQELLFYCDAWLAGVAVPCLIVLGLLADSVPRFQPAREAATIPSPSAVSPTWCSNSVFGCGSC